MNRFTICAAIGLAYAVLRLNAHHVVAPVIPVAAPISQIGEVAKRMSAADRSGLHDAYAAFSKAVAADPVEEPVFPDCAALRRAHRAMLLVVWRGVLGGEPGKVPGLKEAVEGAFEQRIGTDDVLLTPDLKQSAAKALADIAASFK